MHRTYSSLILGHQHYVYSVEISKYIQDNLDFCDVLGVDHDGLDADVYILLLKLKLTYICGILHQKQVSREYISNCILLYFVGSNYLSILIIPASGTKVLISIISVLYTQVNVLGHGPLARYVKLWIAHAPGMPGTFSPPPISTKTTS